jgi:hypothetical protein
MTSLRNIDTTRRRAAFGIVAEARVATVDQARP